MYSRKDEKNYNMAETGTLLKAGNWYGKVDNLWDELEFILMDILQYSGHFANFAGYSKIFELFSKFLVDIIFSQCFRFPTFRRGRYVGYSRF